MPLYEYKCPNCNRRFSKVKAMVFFLVPEKCPYCGIIAEKLVSTPRIISDDLGTTHMDPTFGNIHSKSELRRLEKEAGLRVREPGYKKDIQSARRDKEKKQDILRNKIIGDSVMELN